MNRDNLVIACAYIVILAIGGAYWGFTEHRVDQLHNQILELQQHQEVKCVYVGDTDMEVRVERNTYSTILSRPYLGEDEHWKIAGDIDPQTLTNFRVSGDTLYVSGIGSRSRISIHIDDTIDYVTPSAAFGDITHIKSTKD